MYTINFPAIAPSAAHNFSVKTIEFKMAAVSVKKSIELHPNMLYKIYMYIVMWCCPWSYVGETGRFFETRKKEHVRNVSLMPYSRFQLGLQITLFTFKFSSD